MAADSRGADALARSLKNAGVTRLFALSGNHVMSVFDALLDTGIELIHTRHEASTVHMADAWARVTGEPGIALVTGGPGHANAVSALYTAYMAESPIVLLSGHAPNNQLGMGSFQEMAQAAMAAPVTKAAWASAGAESLAGDIARALCIARAGRPGPVNLNLPADALQAKADMSRLPDAHEFGSAPVRLDAGAAKTAMDLLARAARPLILAGPSLMTRRGRERLSIFEEACGIPVVGMESPRGIGDPSLGAFAQVLAEADCVLLLGKRLDFTLGFGKPPGLASACEFLQIDPEQAEIDRSRRALGSRLKFAAIADAFPALDELAAERSGGKPKSAWMDEVRAAVRYRPPAWDAAVSNQPGRVHPVQFLRPLQAILDGHPESVFVSDGGEIGQWAQACLHAPHRVINGVAGSIGAALPFALAARSARPDAPVVAIMGDGTFGFHMAEMDTAVTHKLPFVAVVGNDARWNAEYQIQLKEYGPERATGCEMRMLRYDLITAAFGGHAELVTDAGMMLPAVRRAMESGLPACINVMIEGLPAPQIARPAAQ